MSAVDPEGEMKQWFFGLPCDGVLNGSIDTGTMKYWLFGLPAPFTATVGAGGGGPTIRRLTLLGAG